MSQLVVAVFERQSMADKAVNDLENAMIPSVVIGRSDGANEVQRSRTDHRQGCPLVTVAVDEVHTGAVVGILNQHGSAKVK